MNKAVSIGIGVGIGLIALAAILLAPGEMNESSMGVELSDEIDVVADEAKEYTVDISEGLKVGDDPWLFLCLFWTILTK